MEEEKAKVISYIGETKSIDYMYRFYNSTEETILELFGDVDFTKEELKEIKDIAITRILRGEGSGGMNDLIDGDSTSGSIYDSL